MSQRMVNRGFFLCFLAVLTSLPAAAQTAPGTITFSPNPVTFAVGETSPLITAQISFSVGQGLPGGLQTLVFGVQAGLPPGITTIPSTVTYTTAAGQATATVSFQLAAAPNALPGSSGISVFNTPTSATGPLNFVVLPVSLAPSSLTVAAGSTSASVTATVGYPGVTPTGPQQLVFSGLPAGASPVPSPVTFTVPLRQFYAIVSFAISTSLSTPPGSYTVTVSTSPQATGSDTFLLVVGPPPALSVAPGAAAISVCSGGPAVSNTVTITPLSGFQGSPTVTFPSLPVGLTVTPSPIPVPLLPPARTVSFDVSAAAGMTAGPRTVNVLVQDPAGVTTQTTFTVNVSLPDFAPSVAPASVSLKPNGPAATVLASVAPSSCPPQSSILVTPSSVPQGVSVSPSSVLLTPPSFQPASFSISASGSASPGRSTVTFTFSPDGGPTKTTTAEVVVRSVGSLSVAVENSTLNVCPGGAAVPNSVTVTPLDGYAGSPTLTFPALPAELKVSPVSIPIGALPPASHDLFRDFRNRRSPSGTEGRERPGERRVRLDCRYELRRERGGSRLLPGCLARGHRARFRGRRGDGHGVPGAWRVLPAVLHHRDSLRPAGRRHRDAGLGRSRWLLRTLRSPSRFPPPNQFPQGAWR